MIKPLQNFTFNSQILKSTSFINSLRALVTTTLCILSILSASGQALYTQNFNNGAGGWTSGTVSGRSSTWSIAPRSNINGSNNYGTPNSGNMGYENSYIMSPAITINSTTATIDFDSYNNNEGGFPSYYDVEWVEYSLNNGASWTAMHQQVQALHFSSGLKHFSFSATIPSGSSVRFRFRYDTGDGCCGPDGWYIDNVAVNGTSGSPLRSDAASTNVTCFGSNDGTATITATGGSTPYTYSIGNNSVYQTSNKFLGLPAGQYTLKVKDAAGAISSSEVSITQPEQTTASITASGATEFCPGGNVTLTANESGTYVWNSGDTTKSIQVSSSGNYYVTITNGIGCSAKSSSIAVKATDSIAPIKPVLADVIAECSATVSAPTTSDNCAGTISGTTNDPLVYTAQGSYVVTWSFNDGNGNITTATQKVTVQDLTAPTVSTNNISVTLVGGSATITAASINNGSFDNCGIKSISISKSNFDCSNVGVNTVVLTVVDNNDNVSTANATVTVSDNIAPIAIAKNISVTLVNGSATITAASVDNGSSDACGIKSLVLSKTAFDCSNVGPNTVILTVTDNNDNVSTTTATVTVSDNIAPIAIAKNISVTLVNGSATITAASVDNGSSDACGIKSLSINKSSFDCSNLGSNTVILTVTDNNGNVSTASAVVTVIGATPIVSIAVSRTDGTFTGLDSKTIALGYGAQALTLTASNSTSASTASTYVWSPAAGLSSTTTANPVFTPTAAGTYTYNVTATNEFGCTASTSVTLTVLDVRCGTKNDKVLVCHKTGSTKNPWNQICISASAVDAHLKKGSTLGTCSSTQGGATAFAGTELTLSNLLVASINELSVYPNPFAKQSTVTYTLTTDEAKVSLDLFDLKGSKVQNIYTGSANASEAKSFSFDSSNLASGVYFFRLTGNNIALNFKVIVSK
jgi:hypothetical protein